MLRSSLLRASRPNIRAVALRSQAQWLQGQQSAFGASRRLYSDKKPDENILPGSETASQTSKVPPPPELASTTTTGAAPLPPTGTISTTSTTQPTPAPPGAEAAKVASSATSPNPATPAVPTGEGSASVASTPEPPKKKRRFIRFLANLLILSTLGYGIGVYYALTSDNWHDFFTEYVPFGEEAVAYFEEREFRKRFLSRPRESGLHPQVRGEAKVTVPGRAGVSAKSVDATELNTKARNANAVEEPKPLTKAEKVEAVKAKSAGSKPKETVVAKKEEKKAAPAVAVESTAAPVKHIDNLNVDNASEPVVQDLVKILNDIITVVNADNASGKYGSTIEKAKEGISKVVADIGILKDQQKKSVEDQLSNLHAEFDNAARELLRRSEQQIQDLETRWREEYETERGNLSQSYDSKLQSELDSAKKLYNKNLENSLLEQAIALRKEFTRHVQDTVEAEREGRLSKLDKLSSSVSELERLTGEWNSVVDSTIQTQHLQVAVETVRSILENTDRPRPFTTELAALKEVAGDNPVVNAAIASINPSAYQRGVSTPRQLVDRFRRVASEVRKAALLPDNAGVASHAASLVLSKVMFKKGGLPVGDDVESILTRTEILLEEGNLEDAVQEANALTGWAKTLSRDWLGECRRVLEVQQALEVISTEARLRSLLVE